MAAELPPLLAAALATRPLSDAEWRSLFPVRTEASANADPPGPTLFGSYSRDGAAVVFHPRLPFLPGTAYVAVLHTAALRDLAGAPSAADEQDPELRFLLPTPSREAPRVLAIVPSAETVPANLLRAYLHFSLPMRPDVAPRYVRLLEESGAEVEMPFVEIDGGLWNPEGTRLTLLFHPGRIKRGVAPGERLGPPLEEGGSYRLVVEPGWPAATGETLAVAATRTWSVGPPDRDAIDPLEWVIQTPHAGTTEPLRVRFGEPLDPALALRLIAVTRAGERQAGSRQLAEGETAWSFTPRDPWAVDDYLLSVDPTLEDVAGNSLRGAFDRAPGEPEAGAGTRVEIPFRPRR